MAAVQAKLGGAEKVTEIQDALAARIVEQIATTQASMAKPLAGNSRGRQKNIGADPTNCSCVWGIYSRSLTSQAKTNASLQRTKITGTMFRALPDGTVGAPSDRLASDNATSGICRTAANEIAISNNSTFNAKFTTSGFQVGSGTAAAQLHIFDGDTTDRVIIENTDAGLDTAPDLVRIATAHHLPLATTSATLSPVARTPAAQRTPTPRSAHRFRPSPTALRMASLI